MYPITFTPSMAIAEWQTQTDGQPVEITTFNLRFPFHVKCFMLILRKGDTSTELLVQKCTNLDLHAVVVNM